MNNIEIIKVSDEYVLSYIIEPGKKVYYVSDDVNGIHCTTSILGAFRFLSRNNCLNYNCRLQDKFGLDFSIEKVEV